MVSKSTKKRVKKPSLPKLMKKADKIFSEWIRNRDQHCVLCGTTYQLCNGHLVKRGKHSTRFDEKNCNCLCKRCNFRDEFDHDIYVSWFLKKYGEEEYQDLVKRGHTIKKFNRYELEELIERYK